MLVMTSEDPARWSLRARFPWGACTIDKPTVLQRCLDNWL